LGKHLGHAQASYQNAERRLDPLGQRLMAAAADPDEAVASVTDGKPE
jgi:hypothetical protein